MTASVIRGRGLLASGREARRPDAVLIIAFLLLAAFSVVIVHTASLPRQEALGLDPTFDMRRQIAFAAVGGLAFLIGSLIDHRVQHTWAPAAYVAALVALVAVFTVGEQVGLAQRWIPVGTFQLQPSEFAKVAVIVLLAAVLAPTGEHHVTWKRMAAAIGVVAAPALLIYLQPDFGTMVVFGFILVVMLFAAGTSMWKLLAVAAGAVVALAVLWQLDVVDLEAYQLERLTTFLNEDGEQLAGAYSQIQSEVAIGSGQLFGKGLFEGTQTNLAFVPNQTTDFIFTAVGEQLGFAGGALVLAVYAVIVWRLLRSAAAASDRFGMLVTIGVASLIMFHLFVNVGMTLGILPVTGLPLPFLSHGGSSFVAFALALGLAHSIWLHRSKVPARSSTIS